MDGRDILDRLDRGMKQNFRPTRRLFGRYELLMEMARGGMATIFLARMTGPKRFEKLIVLKRIHSHLAQEVGFTRMFLDEARINAMIHHPNVATVFDMGEHGGAYYLTMEHVHGEDLAELLYVASKTPASLPWSYAARIVCDAAAGLHAAHESKNSAGKSLNVVHRDVSPQNILISYDGNVKVVDFGIAYAAERVSKTATGRIKGKAAYMAPEQVLGQPVDRRADIFALGIVLWEAVCLKRLFREDSDAATLLRVQAADVPRPRAVRSDIPVHLEALIIKALRKNPDERYQTAGEFGAALERLLVNSGEYVSHQDLADLMQQVFKEEKGVKDRRIREATTAVQSGPAHEATASLDTPTEAVEPLDGAKGRAGARRRAGSREREADVTLAPGEGSLSQVTLRKRRAAVLVGALAAVAAMVVLVGVLMFRTSGRTEPGSSGGRSSGGSGEAATSPRPDPRRDPVRPAPPSIQAEVPTVTFKVTVRPAEARTVVRFKGKRYRG
jgi:serine/threonine-protein kinase